MWLVAMFDLPVGTKRARKEYAQFRKALIRDGFTMMQFSVYSRHVASRASATCHSARVRAALPPEGEVRLLTVTDRQFETMEVYAGKRRTPTEQPPRQLEFF
jgi:CRISPR-associated protein Cas2